MPSAEVSQQARDLSRRAVYYTLSAPHALRSDEGHFVEPPTPCGAAVRAHVFSNCPLGKRALRHATPSSPFWIRTHVGTLRRILRLPVGKVVTEQWDHSCFRLRSCILAMHNTHYNSTCSAKIMPSSTRSKRNTNRRKLTIAITDLHNNANQASVANHDQETLLREHHFSCMFACTGSFQLPSVRHATPITRSTRSLTETGRRDASLIFLHAWTGASYWPSDCRCCFFHDRPSSRSASHVAESTRTSTCSKQRGNAI